MFAFTVSFIMKELELYQPDITSLLKSDYAKVVENFAAMPSISIDYAVAEQSKEVVVLPLSCYWNDIGSWDAIYEILPKDEDGNACREIA